MRIRRFFRRLFFTLFVFVLLGLTAFLLRKPLLREAGNFLVVEDAPVATDAIFVLSGEAEERCTKAAELWTIFGGRVIPTGAGVDGEIAALGLDVKDAQINRRSLMRHGVDSTAIVPLPAGTSTWEESLYILAYCQAFGLDDITVVSSKFHTRRMGWVFRKRMAGHGIRVRIMGADPIGYTVGAWWKSEKGLIFVNNEYIKLLYYQLMYGG